MADTTPRFPHSPTRRGVVAAAGGAGLAAALTACGGSDSSGKAAPQDDRSSAASPSGSAAGTAGSGSGGGTVLGKSSDVPVGGGTVYADQKVVVTQPTAGRFTCFSAVCTHQGCTVAKVSDGLIQCPCHGSAFHIADGSVATGPAVAPLPAKQITVSGGEISLA
ncbi:Rieske (2Fe-2S) protein [Actinacidiphila yeochonensis]|uniref:Rieske (2Fe-2S) protein n=1 Tax=Actinacidiphila yeochonensis TaxID=89050 RepID=UPI00056CAC7B|nr:Rieske (2Fe-2S) protein [Actinacidiphila yeochonensis]